MSFHFEVEDKILRQKKSHTHKKDLDNLFASFVFTTSEWKHLDKYVIFWNRKGKSTIRFLGKGTKTQCPIPKSVLNDLYFTIQIYANDNVFTQRLKVYLKEDIPEDGCCPSYQHLNKYFEEMEKKIDNIVYEDNKLLIYINNELVKSIDLVDGGLLQKIFAGGAPEYIVDMALSDNSDLPVANRVIYEALENKLDKTSLSAVAVTGSYNDLTDIPEEFTPAQHQHNINDIVDLDASLDDEVDDFIDKLIENL